MMAVYPTFTIILNSLEVTMRLEKIDMKMKLHVHLAY